MNELEDAFFEVCAPEYYILGMWVFLNMHPVLENMFCVITCWQMILFVWL